jgi:hypothetical protein
MGRLKFLQLFADRLALYASALAISKGGVESLFDRVRFLLLPMILCFTFLAAGLKAQTPQSMLYSNASEGFEITFPAEPELSKKNVDTDSGPFELRAYICSVSSIAYMVGVTDYGNAVNKDPNTMLQDSKNGALKNSNAHLITEQRIKLSIVSGLAFEAENNDVHFSARTFIAGTTLYQVIVVYPIGNPPADAASFLDSFGLIVRSEE